MAQVQTPEGLRRGTGGNVGQKLTGGACHCKGQTMLTLTHPSVPAPPPPLRAVERIFIDLRVLWAVETYTYVHFSLQLSTLTLLHANAMLCLDCGKEKGLCAHGRIELKIGLETYMTMHRAFVSRVGPCC